MAYQNQIKCAGCGVSIPDVPENACFEEQLCDKCLDEVEKAIEEFGNIIGELESWQHRYPEIEWIPQPDINAAKHRLIDLLNNMENQLEPIKPIRT